MTAGAAPTSQASSDDASPYSYSWTSQNSPDDPPVTKVAFFNLVNLPGFRDQSPVVAYRVCSIEATLEFNLNFKLWRYTPFAGPNIPGKPLKVLSCSLETTRFVPAKLVPPLLPILDFKASPSPQVVGPYTESINVQMGFDDPRPELHSRSPDTDVQRGQVTTSISYSFTGGFFGSSPNASADVTYSHSATMDLTDYLIRSDSDIRKTNHSVLMEMLADGNRYTDVNSISYMEFPPAWHASDQLLTARSTSDLTMAMQGLWLLPGESEEDLIFRATVTAVCPVLPNLLPALMIMPIPALPDGVSLGDQKTMTRADFAALAPQNKYPDDAKFTFVWERDVKIPLAAADTLQSGRS